MTIYNWTISTTNYDVATGFINCAHWQCNAVDGEYTANPIYSTCSFSKPEENVDLTPYDAVTEQDVLGWCWSSGVDKDATEAALAAQIEAQKNPVTATGVPW
jgi:hypothetical protein